MRKGLGAPEPIRRANAARLGVTVEEYDAHLRAGEMWCSHHVGWHPMVEFPSYRNNYCRQARAERERVARAARLKRVAQDEHRYRCWLLARVLVK